MQGGGKCKKISEVVVIDLRFINYYSCTILIIIIVITMTMKYETRG